LNTAWNGINEKNLTLKNEIEGISGIYFLRVKSSETVYSFKLIFD